MARVSAIALATNQDGRLELVALAGSEEGAAVLWHRWERLEGGGWSDWQSLGPVGGIHGDTLVQQRPAVAQNKQGCLEVVTVEGTMRLHEEVYRAWQQHPGRAWRGWHVLRAPGGEAIASVTALGQNKDGRLELFAVDQNGAVWHRFQNNAGGWLAEWHPLGKPGPLGASSDTVVARNKDGRLELFAQASDHEVWHCWQRREGGWSPWASLGPPSQARALTVPAVAQNKDGRLEVFQMDGDKAVWHCWQRREGGWSPWKPLGMPAGGAWDLTVGAHADGRLVVFTTAEAPQPPDGSPPYTELWWREQAISGGWSDWTPIGVAAAGDTRSDHRFIVLPTLALNADGRLEMFGVAGVDSVGLYWLRQISPSGGEWEGAWVDLQPPPPSQLTGSHLSP